MKETQDRTDWLGDGMAAVAVKPPQETYRDFADATLSSCKPKDVACTKSLTILFDLHNNTSIKQSTLRSAKPSRLYYRYGAKTAKTR